MTIRIKFDPAVINEVYRPYIETDKRFEIYYGGAGSGKSVFIAQKKVLNHLTWGNRKTLVLRKVGRTSRHSTFAEIAGVISDWNLTPFFEIQKGNLEIHGVNNSHFIFLGLDDREKIKSIKGITDIWMEEASEFSEDDLKQLNLRLRGRAVDHKQITLSFNPISALSWLKSYFFDNPRENALILKTTYKDNSFLDESDIAEIESLKEIDPIYYKVYGLGEWGVLGDLVYTNYSVSPETWTAEDFNTTYNGLDWGFNDPAALVRIGFKDSKIYIFDELYEPSLTNSQLMREAENQIGKSDLITADSSEPARVKEWQNAGWNIRGAKKGKDSIRFGIDFCRRHEIVISHKCQNFINEIQGYQYRKDKDGNTLEEPVDYRNHLMDAMRYALEDLAYERKIEFLR